MATYILARLDPHHETPAGPGVGKDDGATGAT